MKMFYFFKSILPYLFLPLAPSVVQMELVWPGLLTGSNAALVAFSLQVIFTLGIVVFVGRTIHRRSQAKMFVKMSCVSKKVFHDGKWMTVERYLAEHHNIVVSHGMTPEESEAWLRESEEYVREVEVAPPSTLPRPSQGVLSAK